MKKKKAYTDKYILKLWRNAVLKDWNGRCFICGNDQIDQLECHHIVKRRNKILRYDYWCGVPVCKMGCHNQIDSIAGRKLLTEHIPTKMDYLAGYEKMTFKDYLSAYKITENEFLTEKVNNLKEIIRGVE